ncbi:uncharacterized protein PRCAT00003409001 [Priceomyces carsonii]|uniref:uncharacterized protein n=1 Tax=Priceomyces carsonii TaxID=28549 RepID=UPI002ED9EA3D|nr:unnamed protein product [Priceomyces carsonii]
MTDYYEPTMLFRQNAIRRYNKEVDSLSDTSTKIAHNSIASWLLNYNSDKDKEVTNRSCSLNNLNFRSSYWRIPDSNMNLTSMDVSSNTTDITSLAIASGNESSNLFLYDLNLQDTYLSHKSTITLPHIYSLKWVPKAPGLIITGNSKGYAHLVSVPTSEDPDDQAEIYKRFNHRKHLKSINKSSSIEQHGSTAIKSLNFVGENLMSVYDNNLFLWDLNGLDTQLRPRPASIASIYGLSNVDTIPNTDKFVGICGKFGVSLFDLREPKFSVPSAIIRNATKLRLGSPLIKWNPEDENVCAAAHNDGVVRLWDVRKQDHFATLHGYPDKVCKMEWMNGDLFTGGRHGNIIHWNIASIDNTAMELTECGLNQGFQSVNFNPITNSLESIKNQRQCGTLLPASNCSITGMCSINAEGSDKPQVLSIDSSALFGVHSRICETINVEDICHGNIYYSKENLDLLAASEQTSNTTLVNSSSETINLPIEPLAISHAKHEDFSCDEASETSVIEEKDSISEEESFVFEMPDMFAIEHENFSGISLVDSIHDSSSDAFNDSMESLSTNPTIFDDNNDVELPASPKIRLHQPLPSLSLALDFNFAMNFENSVF